MEFTIENNFLCVRVQSRGAELCSVVKKETGEEMVSLFSLSGQGLIDRAWYDNFFKQKTAYEMIW